MREYVFTTKSIAGLSCKRRSAGAQVQASIVADPTPQDQVNYYREQRNVYLRLSLLIATGSAVWVSHLQARAKTD